MALKYAEQNKAKADFESKDYWLADGEINEINSSLSLIKITLGLIK